MVDFKIWRGKRNREATEKKKKKAKADPGKNTYT